LVSVLPWQICDLNVFSILRSAEFFIYAVVDLIGTKLCQVGELDYCSMLSNVLNTLQN